jgi:radical SAM superfamily enzyme YgiQ (UPF0313 family)
MVQSHYNHFGKYADKVEWLPAPYRFNQYATIEELYEEISSADIVLLSSYAWNYTIVDELAKHIKKVSPATITVLGGPHIGTNEPEFLDSRDFYDFVCQPTKPGEPFVEDLIDSYFETNGAPDMNSISWELRCPLSKKHDINTEFSVYEEHLDYLKEILSYAQENQMEPFMVIETTRGCPYQCVFCEWGGGTGTKIIKKNTDLVKRDILALKRAGFRDAYLTDANFGAFEDRDIEIFRFAWENGINLTDISTMKSKDLDRRKRLIDKWFEIVGSEKSKTTHDCDSSNMWDATEYSSLVPTVSIQSISEEAMKVAKRVDLSTQDKLELSRHISNRCRQEGFPVPALELILGMPGSTLEDFYDEVEIIWNFKAWGSHRHDYMFLPDSTLNDPEYKREYQIQTVEVYSDIVDEDGIDNWESLYKDKKTYFKTMLSCYSYTEDELKEMWFMNSATNHLLENFYVYAQDVASPQDFAKTCYAVIRGLDDFKPIKAEIDDIFDPYTPARSIRTLQGKFRVDAICEMIDKNFTFIKSAVLEKLLGK